MPEPHAAALRVRGLRKAYRDVVAVDGIDLDVPLGECFGLLGPNGAGKTTTIEICEGLTTPDSGEDHGHVIALGTPNELMASIPMPPREPRVHAATLEDVFVALTGRHLRDE